MEKSIVPMGQYLLVRVIEEEQTSESGLVLSAQSEPTNIGTVISTGDKVNTDSGSTPVNKDDKVIFIPNTGVKVSVKDTALQLINIKNVIGLIKGE